MTKMSIIRKSLALLFLVLAQGTAVAQETSVIIGGVKYEIVDDQWMITGVDHSSFPEDGVITLKSQIQVDQFGDGTPRPQTIKTIRERAFQNNSSITGVNFEPKSNGQHVIQHIGSFAFDGCTNLTSLTLPSSITDIGEGAFTRSSNLRWVDCRQVTDGWYNDLIGEGRPKSPLSLGASDYTLMYMPKWCNQTNYHYTNVVFTDNNGDRTCPEYRYSHNLDYCVPYDFTAGQVSVDHRTLSKDDDVYSICLPYNLSVPQGAKAYELEGKETEDGKEYAVFSQINSDMVAFTPYLILAEEQVIFSCDEPRTILTTDQAKAQVKQESMTAAGITIHGTFNRINKAEAKDRYYILQTGNTWKKVGENNVNIPPYRAYLTLADSQNSSIYIDFSDETNAISQQVLLTPSCIVTDNAWVTLQGQRLPTPPNSRGIYIYKGKKMVIR